MPVAPVAGIPPLSTLESIDRSFEHFPTPYYIAPGLTKQNFYRKNGQMILAALVALLMLIFMFLNTTGVLGASVFSSA